MRRLFPFPYLSLLLLITWLLMNNSVSPGQILLGGILALVIPLGTASMRKTQPTLKKPFLAVKYLLMLMGDIIVSNIEVAIQVLGPVRNITPGFIAVPLDISQDLPITLLASSISLTPGTVSLEVSEDKQWLYVHVLNLVDEAGTIANIKQRYESPLREIFGC
ncbi:Na+/H+ antiporter subunit E [Saccharospirillum impatiens]|uniref:Na+/H+ antiporter subunit E n=1 Tax=Saccharospirillum impatiens TaxID=169438 RepID=UPI0003FFEAAD|nr:Na+/H+ antiporter subunit E [Saccharospirillum impatiens]